jgi:hypothetical protein
MVRAGGKWLVPSVVGLALIATSCSTIPRGGVIEGSFGLCGGPGNSSSLVFLSRDGVKRTAKVTEAGHFKFDGLPPGNYTVRSAATGPELHDSVSLGAGATSTVVFCQVATS